MPETREENAPSSFILILSFTQSSVTYESATAAQMSALSALKVVNVGKRKVIITEKAVARRNYARSMLRLAKEMPPDYSDILSCLSDIFVGAMRRLQMMEEIITLLLACRRSWQGIEIDDFYNVLLRIKQ